MEGLRLRVQDIDFDTNEITVHCGKGAKDRKTVLPVSLKFPLQNHLEHVRRIHEEDCKDGFGATAVCSCEKISQCRYDVDVVVGVSPSTPVAEQRNGRTRAASYRSFGYSANCA